MKKILGILLLSSLLAACSNKVDDFEAIRVEQQSDGDSIAPQKEVLTLEETAFLSGLAQFNESFLEGKNVTRGGQGNTVLQADMRGFAATMCIATTFICGSGLMITPIAGNVFAGSLATAIFVSGFRSGMAAAGSSGVSKSTYYSQFTEDANFNKYHIQSFNHFYGVLDSLTTKVDTLYCISDSLAEEMGKMHNTVLSNYKKATLILQGSQQDLQSEGSYSPLGDFAPIDPGKFGGIVDMYVFGKVTLANPYGIIAYDKQVVDSLLYDCVVDDEDDFSQAITDLYEEGKVTFLVKEALLLFSQALDGVDSEADFQELIAYYKSSCANLPSGKDKFELESLLSIAKHSYEYWHERELI